VPKMNTRSKAIYGGFVETGELKERFLQ
jgi:hypothetical protein